MLLIFIISESQSWGNVKGQIVPTPPYRDEETDPDKATPWFIQTLIFFLKPRLFVCKIGVIILQTSEDLMSNVEGFSTSPEHRASAQ